MKKLITKNKIIQKTIMSILIVLVLSFGMPVRSQADAGGILLDPIFDLAGTIFDVAIGGLQAFLVDGNVNNSEDGGVLNAFLAKPENFLDNDNGKYDEFQYPTDGGEAIEKIEEDKLDKTLILGNATYYIPTLRYTPDKIFANLIPALDINFINPNQWNGNTDMQERSVAMQLHDTIATWYVALRNLSIVGLMLVLVYVGIRIIICSTSSDKAKYKQMLMDWLIAMCLLFCLHYIMSFTVTIVEEISKTINGATGEANGNNITVAVVENDGSTPVKENGKDVKFSTDLMGLIRFKVQYNNLWNKLLYLILYMAMVIYTCLFTFYYLKRVITMAFLTLIAPLVALTYPIDKLKDGKSQAFDMWLKEYIFNALLQPFHLIIYTIFVSSSIELTSKNPIFAIISIAFIIPAEKLLRKFFGFEKASTAGALGGLVSVAGGAAAMNFAKHLIPSKGGKGGSGGKDGIKTRKTPNANVEGIAESGVGKNGDNNQNEKLEKGGPELVNKDTNVATTNRNKQEQKDIKELEDWDNNDMYLHPENYSNLPTQTALNEQEQSLNSNLFQRAFKSSENDERGVGQWLKDGAKSIGREARRKIS